MWVKGLGKYNCCNNINRDSKGCEPVTIHLISKTDRDGCECQH